MNDRISQLLSKATKKTVTREWDEETRCFGPLVDKYELDKELFANLLLEDCCMLIEDLGLENLDSDTARLYTKAIKMRFGLDDHYPFKYYTNLHRKT